MDWLDTAMQPTIDALRMIHREKLAHMYAGCFRSTWDTTLTRDGDTVFLITGDIPAMWLRDSSAQVYHYLPYAARFPLVRETILGLIRRQMQCIVLDPYANAFNRTPSDAHYRWDETGWTDATRPWIWERKYEIDSLCYPVRLAHGYWKHTGCTDFADSRFMEAARAILAVFTAEQKHMTASSYFFRRSMCPPSDTLPCEGKGNPVSENGLIWSGFRPSDDACVYGYLIPSNFFACRALQMLADMLEGPCGETGLARTARQLADAIASALTRFATVSHPEYGTVYAYEIDGLGHALCMDDANVPSLLSLPYLECLSSRDPVYQNTRRMLLSDRNPYYYEGTCCRGIGSPHTPRDYVWPIALCVQGLTSEDPAEIQCLAAMLENMDADTGLMHEGVHKDQPSRFTRPWFAWANSIFAEFIDYALPFLA